MSNDYNYAVVNIKCVFHDNGTENTWKVVDGEAHNMAAIGAREWAGGFSTIVGDASSVYKIWGIA